MRWRVSGAPSGAAIAFWHQSRFDSLIGPAGPGPSFSREGMGLAFSLHRPAARPRQRATALPHTPVIPAQVIEVRRHHRRRRGKWVRHRRLVRWTCLLLGENGLTRVLVSSAEIGGVLILRFYQIRNMECPPTLSGSNESASTYSVSADLI
jgi:hypothetical protein